MKTKSQLTSEVTTEKSAEHGYLPVGVLVDNSTGGMNDHEWNSALADWLEQFEPATAEKFRKEIVSCEPDWQSEITDELHAALSGHTPSHCFVGYSDCEPGVSGCWPSVDSAREAVEFISSGDQDCPPDDFRGEWLHISDHGNVTLYLRGEDGTDSEIWSLV